MFSSALETEAGEKAAKEEAVVENTTPDYAAGLVSAQVRDSTCSHHSNIQDFSCFVSDTLSPSLSYSGYIVTNAVWFFRNWGR